MKKNEKLEQFLNEAIEDRTSKIAKLTMLVETETNVSTTKDAWRKAFITDCATELNEYQQISNDYHCGRIKEDYIDIEIKSINRIISESVVIVETDNNRNEEEKENLRKTIHAFSVKRKVYESIKDLIKEESDEK